MGQHGHKRETNARRRLRLGVVTIAAPVALGVTACAVSVGVATSHPATHQVATPAHGLVIPDLDRKASVSRSFSRLDDDLQPGARLPVAVPGAAVLRQTAKVLALDATKAAVRAAHTIRWTTTDLNLWDGPGAAAAKVDDLAAGAKVLVTGRSVQGRDEVVVKGRSRWVTSGYLSDQKPIAAAAGLSMAPCPDTSVEYRLTSAAVYLYRSVCHAFPQITTYGGYAARGEHASGKALDIMTTDTALGNAIRAFLIEHASELDLYDVIWQQHIWTPVRASEGFRFMPDRGSATANHFDHVHVSVN